ncbi:MAG TPA: EpsI family protein [Sedimentisphaerales bacterium]|nr:EpsI family protein [Sedimentisphaerales bacterium]
MRKKSQDHSRVIITAAAMSVLMVASGLIYRTVASPVKRIPLDPNTLSGFPLQIGDWVGEEVPIDPDIEDAMDVDSYVSRRYVRTDGQAGISLYMPCGTDIAQLLQHIPENCYVGAGWILTDHRMAELSFREQGVVPGRIVQFARSGLDMRKLVLFHFLVVDGECFTSFSAVAKAKGWRHFAEVRYAAQVQIVSSADSQSIEAATQSVLDFARDAYPTMKQFFQGLDAAFIAQERAGTSVRK